LTVIERALKDPGCNLELKIPQAKSLIDCLNKKALPQIDICGIGAAGFRRYIDYRDVEIFYVTLYKIKRLIDNRLCGEAGEDKQQIVERLLEEYYKFTDVFSKREFDLMPPFRANIDFKIYLEDGSDLFRDIGHGPIYKMNVEELKALYKYMVENLDKGFIEPSSALFASPILMARHSSTGKLRFCVDYRRLNAITKKNRYLISLVDEFINWLAGAKYFTKLDIC
jgi:hypothetical protein